MRRALAIALLAAGCFSDRGLAIEVDIGTTDATTIELFVGNAACTPDAAARLSCETLQPPGLRVRLDGIQYFRNDEVAFRAQVQGRKVRFRLEAETDTDLPIVIAIGSNAAGPSGAVTLHDLVVPASDATVVQTSLEQAGEITGSSIAGGQLVKTWPDPEDDRRTCVAVEHWTSTDVTRDFIGPADDPDCDGITGAQECDPEVYRSQHPSPKATPSCFAELPARACLLGAQGCMDGMGMTQACDPFANQVCVPDRFCECTGPSAGEACGPRTDPTFDRVPHFHCSVRVPLGGTAVCQSDSDAVALPRFAGGDCGNKPVLSGPHLADLADAADTHDFGDAELGVSHADKGCTLQFKVSGSHGLGTELGMVKIAGASGALIIPIVVDFVAMPCLGKRLECSFEPGQLEDKLWACAR